MWSPKIQENISQEAQSFVAVYLFLRVSSKEAHFCSRTGDFNDLLRICQELTVEPAMAPTFWPYEKTLRSREQPARHLQKLSH